MRFLWPLVFAVVAQACATKVTPDDTSSLPLILPAVGPDSAYRPIYHFTPPQGWMNDPNGMVYHAGLWHLFYQHYPDSNVWGPMHWGHATSEDLVTWAHRPIALYPDELGLIFSGSAVVDSSNTSGFGESPDHPPLVAVYTHHDMAGEQTPGRDDFESQSLSYSLDGGVTWTSYARNPVLPNTDKIRDFRDPKVIWDRAHQQWLMALASKDRTRFYASPDLKSWTFLSDFGADAANHIGVWECPDFFPLIVEGTGETKWVLLQSINAGALNGGSGTFYFVGDWDGKRFEVADETGYDFRQDTKWLDYGRDNYAGVTWSDVPSTDGRRVFLGWMSNWTYAQVVPTTTWRSAMTVPRTLSLHQSGIAGYHLRQRPVAELAARFGSALDFHDGEALRLGAIAPEGAFQLRVRASAKTPIEIALANSAGERLLLGFEPGRLGTAHGAFYIDRRRAGRTDFSEAFATGPDWAPRLSDATAIELTLLFDRTSVELFADDGSVTMTELFWPTSPYETLVSSTEGELQVWR